MSEQKIPRMIIVHISNNKIVYLDFLERDKKLVTHKLIENLGITQAKGIYSKYASYALDTRKESTLFPKGNQTNFKEIEIGEVFEFKDGKLRQVKDVNKYLEDIRKWK